MKNIYDTNGILLEQYRINVGKLKELLKDIPDNYLICVYDNDFMTEQPYILAEKVEVRELTDKPFILIY